MKKNKLPSLALGNSEFRNGNYGAAIYWYLKSLSINARTNETVKFNIDEAKKRNITKKITNKKTSTSRIINDNDSEFDSFKNFDDLLKCVCENGVETLEIDCLDDLNITLSILYKVVWDTNILLTSDGGGIQSLDINELQNYYMQKPGSYCIEFPRYISVLLECLCATSKFGVPSNAVVEKKLHPVNEIESVEYLAKDFFDSEFYLLNNPDVLSSGIDPFEHYKNWGWLEGRNPSEKFDVGFYVSEHMNSVFGEIEPLEHYAKIGKKLNLATKRISIDVPSTKNRKLIERIEFDDANKKTFVPYIEHDPIKPAVKLFAFYLPQFHPFKQNDEWWGKGFTEWYNVTKAVPNFKDHYQPHLPIHCGFYDLRVPEVLREQAILAKNYGLSGFNFYYYWFNGTILMEKPFEILLSNPDIDIEFCITWANENWTRRWDGADNDILISQNHSDSDSRNLFIHLVKYFNDKRYLKINNKPVFIIYRCEIIPDIEHTLKLWRDLAVEYGFEGLYLVAAQTFGFNDPRKYGFDAAMEFPPHTVVSNTINDDLEIINKNFKGNIYNYKEVVINEIKKQLPDYKKFRTTMLSWDNTARKQDQSHIFANFSQVYYKQWLSKICNEVAYDTKLSSDEKLVFVNAWNEWAEGTHLEPDRKYGYSSLQNTYEIIKNYNTKTCSSSTDAFVKKNSFAVIIHLHYTETWDYIYSTLSLLEGFDLFITITNTDHDIFNKIKNSFPSAYLKIVENRGRDIRPFVEIYKFIRQFDYVACCKLHSKKSVYRDDGDKIRDEFFSRLLGDRDVFFHNANLFKNHKDLGLVVLKEYHIPHTNKNMTFNRDAIGALSDLIGINFQLGKFPAGSMYWFSPFALRGLELIEDSFFSIEEGFVDGTVAHAVERLITTLCIHNKFKFVEI